MRRESTNRLHSPISMALLLITLLLMGSAVAVGSPTITGASIGPATLLVTGGMITINANVSDSLSITGVTAQVYLNGGAFGLAHALNPGPGGAYTVNLPSGGNNTTSVAETYTATVSASDSQGTTTVTAANQTVQANDNIPPTITGASIGPTTLLVTGGSITVSASVADPNGRAVTGVTAQVYLNGGAFGLAHALNPGPGGAYTVTLPSGGNNTTSVAETYTATVSATNDLNLTRTVTAAGQTVQANDNTPPTITGASIGPGVLPVAGGSITVSASVADPNGRAITGVTAQVYLNGGAFGLAHALNPGPGGAYTVTLPSGGSNTSVNTEVYTATVTATNDLNLSATVSTANQTVQANSSGTPNGFPPMLTTNDQTKPVLSPAAAVAGDPDLPLIVTGGNFASNATVVFNGVTLTPAGVTANQITVTVPAALIATPGAYAVSVINPALGGFSNSVNLNVLAATNAAPVTLYGLTYSVFSLLTDSQAEDNYQVGNGWGSVIAGHVYQSQLDVPALIPLYRLYVPKTGDHVYTASSGEKAAVLAGGAQDEGITCYVFAAPGTGVIPLYRAYNTSTGQHLYTANAAQFNALTSPWQKDPPIAYILP